MAYMESIEGGPDRDRGRERVVIEALRCYAAVRHRNEPVLPCMVELAGRNGLAPPAVIALASVFELTEACLGRRLAVGDGSGPPLVADEEAVLLLLATAGEVGPHRGSVAVPHGLPGVLVWAVRCACRLCRGQWALADRHDATSCPFNS